MGGVAPDKHGMSIYRRLRFSLPAASACWTPAARLAARLVLVSICAGAVCSGVGMPTAAGAAAGCGALGTPSHAVASRLDSGDRTVRLDACGRRFVIDGARSIGADVRRVDRGRLPAALDRTFELESLPGSPHTLYLDFDGATVEGSAFNQNYDFPVLVAPPFSLSPPADTSFTENELAAIQQAWQVVAEDFAPFDLNVTTRVPDADDLSRTSADDPAWGLSVVATTSAVPLQQVCRCGGLAYVDVAGQIGAERDQHQPAFVFGAVTSVGVGEAISHEVGHMFGLLHDGTSTSPYFRGIEPWAPIMGTGYNEPVTQWSSGEYADANNRQDDVSLIGAYTGFRRDDHADTPVNATPLSFTRSMRGVISARTDVDVFSFEASGRVRLRVRVQDRKADLDVGLRILDAQGNTVATVQEITRSTDASIADGLGATWRAELSPTTATYYALVDGVGSRSDQEGEAYSDYGSLGQYGIRVRR